MDTYETLNGVLVGLFRDVMDLEQKAIITSDFQDITNNDMHVIEAIGIDTSKNMSAIAREENVLRAACPEVLRRKPGSEQ